MPPQALLARLPLLTSISEDAIDPLDLLLAAGLAQLQNFEPDEDKEYATCLTRLINELLDVPSIPPAVGYPSYHAPLGLPVSVDDMPHSRLVRLCRYVPLLDLEHQSLLIETYSAPASVPVISTNLLEY